MEETFAPMVQAWVMFLGKKVFGIERSAGIFLAITEGEFSRFIRQRRKWKEER